MTQRNTANSSAKYRGGPRSSKTKSFPNHLRRLRWQAGLTLEELAEKISTEKCPVHWQHLGLAEREGRGLNRCAWYALAVFFGTTPMEIEVPDPIADFYDTPPGGRDPPGSD